MEVNIYNQNAEIVGKSDLPDGIFGVKLNSDLMHQALTAQLANVRKPVAHTKDRSEVRGGGKKPWKQKGTGRARHGSIRSPIWIGGGVTFGPRKEKSYKRSVNKQVARKALRMVLTNRAAEDHVF